MSAFFEALPLWQDEESSIALIVLSGVNAMVTNSRSSTMYDIVSGGGKFFISFPSGVSRLQSVGEGDQVYIPRGAAYQDSGDLVMLATCEPPFDPLAVKVITQ